VLSNPGYPAADLNMNYMNDNYNSATQVMACSVVKISATS